MPLSPGAHSHCGTTQYTDGPIPLPAVGYSSVSGLPLNFPKIFLLSLLLTESRKPKEN